MEKILSTKRKVKLREMSVDEMDDCGDLQRFGRETDGRIAVYGTNKSNTAWIRKGLAGGDFKNIINGSVPDSIIKELSIAEKIELVQMIQDYNKLGK